MSTTLSYSGQTESENKEAAKISYSMLRQRINEEGYTPNPNFNIGKMLSIGNECPPRQIFQKRKYELQVSYVCIFAYATIFIRITIDFY